MSPGNVLVIDPQKATRSTVKFLLGLLRYQVTTFEYLDECLNWILCRKELKDVYRIVAHNQPLDNDFLFFLKSLKNSGVIVSWLLFIMDESDGSSIEKYPRQVEDYSFSWCLPEDFPEKLRMLSESDQDRNRNETASPFTI